jgi:hypothetical protein
MLLHQVPIDVAYLREYDPSGELRNVMEKNIQRTEMVILPGGEWDIRLRRIMAVKWKGFLKVKPGECYGTKNPAT